MTSKFIKILSSVVCLVWCSCTQQDLLPLPKANPTEAMQTIRDFNKKYGVPIHTFTFDASAGDTFTTPKGTIVEIPANAFYTLSGQLANGEIKFEMREIYAKSDMILSDVTTQSDGHPIVSGGEAWFRATLNNQPLNLNYLNPIVVKMIRDPNVASMQLYAGVPDSTASNWVQVDTATVSTTSQSTGTDTSWYWIYELNGMVQGALDGDWVNCDHPFENYTSTTLTLLPPAGIGTASNYLVVKNSNTVVTLSCGNTYHYAPLGYDCTLVSYAIVDGKLYMHIKPLTISDNQTLSVNLQETNFEDFKAQLEALN